MTEEERRAKNRRYGEPFGWLNSMLTYIAEMNNELEKVKAENAKLRELCTEMFGDLDALIGEDDMMLIGDGSSQRLFSRNDVDAYRNRMRELGIVVDDESV